MARDVLDRNIVAMLSKIRGVPADQLVPVLEEHGAVEVAVAEIAEPVHGVKRARAAQLLGLARAEHAVPLLVEALGDEAVEVRNSAACALGLVGDPAAAGPVLAAIGAPERGLPAATAAEALQSMGVGISDVLRDGLADANARTRMVSRPPQRQSAASPGACPSCASCSRPTPTSPSARRAPRRSAASAAARTSTSSCATPPRTSRSRCAAPVWSRWASSVRPAQCQP